MFPRIGQHHAWEASFILVFAGFYFIATWAGNHHTPDSWMYVDIARNLRNGVGLRDGNGDPMIYWGPLYPIILAVGITHLDRYVWLLHLWCLTASIWLWLRLGKPYLTPFYYRLFGASLALSTPLLMIATFVWSEALFLLLLSAYLFSLRQFLLNAFPGWFMGATVCGFLCLLQRNAGIFVFLGILAGLGLYHRSHPFTKRTRWRLLLHCAVVVSGFTMWNVDRLILGKRWYVLGELIPRYSWIENSTIVLKEIGATLLPAQWLTPLGMACIVVLLGVSISQLWQRKRTHPFLGVLLGAFISYWLAWILIPAHPDDISRFMAVILPLFYFISWYGIEQTVQSQRRIPEWVLQWALVGLFAYPVLRALKNALFWGGFSGISPG